VPWRAAQLDATQTGANFLGYQIPELQADGVLGPAVEHGLT